MSRNFEDIQTREIGLQRALTARQLSMIALGGAIGTGLFLGSKFAIGFAGPSVILSYIIAGCVALGVMAALAEMTVKHPTSGAFGAHAECYIGPFGGFVTRYMYWSCIVLAVGTEVTAVGEYMQLWFPDVPPWIWVVLFSGVLIAVNAANVKSFGTLEYWFSVTKVFAIVAFILLATWLVFFAGKEEYGLHNWTAGSGFMPNGFAGTWFAVIVALFSYLSIEMIAIAAGEAKQPAVAVKQAFKVTFARLIIFYLLTLGLIISIAPVDQILAGGSPFVTVMQVIGIPFADSILNFVVIIAALSAMNSQLYVSTRMMFSLSRAGDAPKAFGKVAKNGTPVNALILCTAGIAVAAVMYVLLPDTAFTVMISISMFGGMFSWFMIFLTHTRFRRHAKTSGEATQYRIPGAGIGSYLGALMMIAILVTTIFTEEFRPTLPFGLPALLVTGVAYLMVRARKSRAVSAIPGGAG